jgi:hypothetical protein
MQSALYFFTDTYDDYLASNPGLSDTTKKPQVYAVQFTSAITGNEYKEDYLFTHSGTGVQVDFSPENQNAILIARRAMLVRIPTVEVRLDGYSGATDFDATIKPVQKVDNKETVGQRYYRSLSDFIVLSANEFHSKAIQATSAIKATDGSDFDPKNNHGDRVLAIQQYTVFMNDLINYFNREYINGTFKDIDYDSTVKPHIN